MNFFRSVVIFPKVVSASVPQPERRSAAATISCRRADRHVSSQFGFLPDVDIEHVLRADHIVRIRRGRNFRLWGRLIPVSYLAFDR